MADPILKAAMSPLADPVVSAIFANAEVAGLAAASLVRVTMEADGSALTGSIVSVTPQRSHISVGERGCRIDIEIMTDTDERVIIEVQVDPDSDIMQRSLLSSSHIYTETSRVGSTSAEMAAGMPRVIMINILSYNLRKDNKDVLQPYKIMYTKPPQTVALPQFCGYNIQLPRLAGMEPDFTSGLYCWYFTLYTAHFKGKSIEEVIAMNPQLQAYAQQDTGYRQFCEQYNLVAADAQARHEYYLWVKDKMRVAGERKWIREEGREEGREETIKKMVHAGIDAAVIAAALSLTDTEINKYLEA